MDIGLYTLDLSFLSVAADSFDRARGECFITQFALLFRFGLLVNERITVIVRAREIVGGGITAHVAIYTLHINVIDAENIFFDAIIAISHCRSPLIKHSDR